MTGRGLPGSCSSSPTPIYTWFSQTEWSPSQLLSIETNIETKGEGRLQDLLSDLQGNGEALTENFGDEGLTHIYNQSLECPQLL